jgi:regulator of nucleoside diphosphate kinase
MTNQSIYITQQDMEKLRELIWQAQNTDYRNSTYLQMLSKELDRAIVIGEQAVPPDVVTMNSRASLVDMDTGEKMEYSLVFPDDADAARGNISVLAPIGTAMLGCRVRDEFTWDTPGGKRNIRVNQVVYQPEAAGDVS